MSDDSDEQLVHKKPKTSRNLGCSIRMVDNLIAAGELDVIRHGRAVGIIAASERAYVERRRQIEANKRAAKAVEEGRQPKS